METTWCEALPVEQRQQGKSVKVQADPQVGEKPQTVVLLRFPSCSRACRILLSQWCILELWTQISVLLLQQLWVHSQQTVQTDLREGDLSHNQKHVQKHDLEEEIDYITTR